jgi:hypothetical protein
LGAEGVFGHKRDEVTGEWKKLHNEELKYLYSVFLTHYFAGGNIEKNEMSRACGEYGLGEWCAQGVGGNQR